MKKVAIIGLGYVGLPLASAFLKAGLSVQGIDADPSKIEKLMRGESYIPVVSSELLADSIEKKRFSASPDFATLKDCDAVLICVPTPLSRHRTPDLSYVFNTGHEIAKHMSKGTLVVLESTTYPGTTSDELRVILEEGSGFECGKDFYLAFSPEREDPGRTDHSVSTIPKVVGGYTPECQSRAKELYSHAVKEVVEVSSCSVAEAVKLTENIFRSVNIALVNELKVVYDAMGIDIWEVIGAASTKPFGYMPFYPGPGLGGHCIPIDPFYLTWKAQEYGQRTRFVELAGEVNTSMPDYVVGKVVEAMNEHGKCMKGAKVLLLGLAYKANVSDERESPSYVIMDKLEATGAQVFYHDPHVPTVPFTREHAKYAGRQSSELSDDYDLLLLLTNHKLYSETDFSGYNAIMVDTRNAVNQRPANYYRA